MKIVFSTKNVSRASFLDTCRFAFDYGFEGFEIYDAIKERSGHYDSILRRERIADAKRKLVNRNLSVSALRMPDAIENESTTAELIEKYDVFGVVGNGACKDIQREAKVRGADVVIALTESDELNIFACMVAICCSSARFRSKSGAERTF